MELQDAGHILLFGGTFDPPTRAHVQLPRRVRELVGADLVAYLPAGQSPHKLHQRPTAAGHRVAMVEAATADDDRSVVLLDEIERAAARPGEPSYTVDTLEALRGRLREGIRLRLLIGADQFRVFHKWHRAERILELAEPVIMVRPPDTREGLLASPPPLETPEAWAGRFVEVPPMEVSATEVRRRVRAGEAIDDLVPRAVARYIREHGLYR